ncbi:hypothetical protein RHSIM_Rhsim08G0179500 [Rhododendron simsii]|uniref:Cytochrome P450 n=1 Tax=Rhododendron simsii TaxID=118357 RepID=A0A834LGA4_RHOSS|nr:hypothetical protein RHSIM_Rhsim08G0179500 [Rhododendron simsii]
MVKIRGANLDGAPINLGELLVQLSSSIISKYILGRMYEGGDNKKDSESYQEGLDAFLDEVIEAHRSSKEDDDRPDKTCFIEILLQLQKEGMMGMDITQQSFKAILLLVGGAGGNDLDMSEAYGLVIMHKKIRLNLFQLRTLLHF